MSKINSQACGRGKSTLMISDILKNLIQGEKMLLILASIDQIKTVHHLLSSKLIHSGIDAKDRIKMIHSTDKGTETTTPKAAINALLKNQVVIITHHTFLLTPWKSNPDLLDGRLLFCDEAINSLLSEYVTWIDRTTPEKRAIDLFEVLQIGESINDKYSEIRYNPGAEPVGYLDPALTTRLNNTNFKAFISTSEYNICKNLEDGRGRFTIHFEFQSDVFKMAKECFFYAAAFEHTLMYHLFKHQQLPMTFIPGCEFNKYDVNVTFYELYFNKSGKTVPVSLSKTNKAEYHDYLVQAEQQMLSIIGKDKFVHLANTKQKVEYEWFNVPNAVRVKHNCQGSNDYLSIDTFVCSAAFRPTNNHKEFIKNRYNIDADQILTTFMVEQLHQAITRTGIRLHENYQGPGVKVFMFDTRAAALLKRLFFNNTQTIPIVINVAPKPKKIKAKQPMTSTQRSRVYRERHKPETQLCDNRIEKKQPMTQAERTRKCRELKKLKNQNGETNV